MFMFQAARRATIILHHITPFTRATGLSTARTMSHSLYQDDTPAEVKNAKVSTAHHFLKQRG